MRKLLVSTALLTAAATAGAATYEVTITDHLVGRDDNPPSASLVNPEPTVAGDPDQFALPDCIYDDVTQKLTCTGTLHVRSQTNPTAFGRIFDRYIVDLTIDGAEGNPGETTSYECVDGGFSQAVGAGFCGNYTFGDNATNDSTYSYGPGLAFDRTIGGDDVIAGDQQSIADYEMTVAEFDAGGELVLQTSDWDAVSSAGTQIRFTVGEEVAAPPADPEIVADAFGALAGSSNNTIDVLANDTNLPANVLVLVTVAPDQSGIATVNPDNTINYSPDAGATAGDVETFTYEVQDVDDGNNSLGTAVVTVTIEADLLPVAVDGAITASSQGSNTATGSVDVSGIAGFEAGNAPATIAITEGTCTVSGTTVSFSGTDVAGGTEATCAYTVEDSNGDVSAPATITVTVTDVQPTLAGGNASGDQGAGDLEATGAFTAGNGSVAQHTLAVTAGNCEVAVAGGNVVVTHGDDEVGEFSCTVTLTDADEDAVEATFDFEVTEPAPDTGPTLPGGKGALDLWSLALLGGLPLLRRRRRA